MTLHNVNNLNPHRFAIIDRETGTIIGTDAVIVELPDDNKTYYEVLESDTSICEYADKYGAPLLAYDSDLTAAHHD